MNKQQLASRIRASANQMRSKIEANEYKDYILGFIFYKFLSDHEEEVARELGLNDQEMKVELCETNTEAVSLLHQKIGYFIAYDNLFSTWLKAGSDFNVSNVRDALAAFSRMIAPTHKKVFAKIFNTLDTGLSKLGDSATKKLKKELDKKSIEAIEHLSDEDALMLLEEKNELKSRFLHISIPSPKSKLVPSGREQAGEQARDASIRKVKARPSKQVIRLLDRMKGEMTVLEMMSALKLGGRRNFLERYLAPAADAGLVEKTQPDSPRSPTQRYRLTVKGLKLKGDAK